MFNLRDQWKWDAMRMQWCVEVSPEEKIYVGDTVEVSFNNGTFTGRVKQVAGFGMHEDRPVISVLFPGRKNGVKVHINQIKKA
jgi:transcription antitermination factor NusG